DVATRARPRSRRAARCRREREGMKREGEYGSVARRRPKKTGTAGRLRERPAVSRPDSRRLSPRYRREAGWLAYDEVRAAPSQEGVTSVAGSRSHTLHRKELQAMSMRWIVIDLVPGVGVLARVAWNSSTQKAQPTAGT